MSSNIRTTHPGQNNIVPGGGSVVVDHWAQVVTVAQPTLAAVPKLRDAREWLAKRKNYDPSFHRLMLNVNGLDAFDEAEARLAIVPDMAFLQDAGKLFDGAVKKSAPEPWFHLAIGAMLRGMPNATNVAPDYSCTIVDMLLYDDDLWERGCEPGFSAPIFVSAIRKVRREQKFVPSAAEILEACKFYRKRFWELEGDCEWLIKVRANAEAVISEWAIPWDKDDFRNRRRGRQLSDDEIAKIDVPF
jgi:hypothetical protein